MKKIPAFLALLVLPAFFPVAGRAAGAKTAGIAEKAAVTAARPKEKSADSAKNKLPPGMKRLPNGDLQFGNLTLHRKRRQISFPAKFVLSEGILEVVVATPIGRLHETLLCADVSPLQLQAMLYLLGLDNGPRLPDPVTGRQGSLVDLDVEWTAPDGTLKREPVEHWIFDERIKAPMKRIGWVFVGSPMRNGVFLADQEGNVCINYSVGATVLDSPDPQSTDDTIFTVNKAKREPGLQTEVRVYIIPRTKKQ